MKHSAISKKLMKVTLKARVFNCEEDAIKAVLSKDIKSGDAVFIRYEGPIGSGMPEMFYTTESIASDPELVESIALVEEDDLIKIDIIGREHSIIGVKGQEKTEKEIQKILITRKDKWVKLLRKYTKGILGIYTKCAVAAMKGGYME